MNFRKLKVKKIVIVILMTMLIWVWADLALDDTFPLTEVTLTISNSRRMFWISFGEQTSFPVEDIQLTGPASKISEVKQRLSDNTLKREFPVDAEQYSLTTTRKLDVVDFLKNSGWIKEMGLTVDSCKPEILDVNVVELVQKDLQIQCIDESGNNRRAESITPTTVRMYVPEDWGGEKLTAFVKLTSSEIERAKRTAISKRPYILLSSSQTFQRDALDPVQIKLPAEEDGLLDEIISSPTLSIAKSQYIESRYIVQITEQSYSDLLSRSIAIKCTSAAKQEYISQTMALMTLHILDSDADEPGKEITREVCYNFPEDFVRRDEIKLNQESATVTFRLIPIDSQTSSSEVAD